jgi:hypothetical protein
MKVTKTSVHRLTVEKTCGCAATREYEDARYTKPIAEGSFTPCEKHEKLKGIVEFAGEMLIETLDREAETAGKAPLAARETVTAMAGTSGGSVTSMGAPRVREKVNPLKPHAASFDRPNLSHPQNVNYGNLNVAQAAQLTDDELAQEEITITGDIDSVAQDPRVDAVMQQDLEGIEGLLDEDDVRTGGVSKTLVDRQAVD